jgi:translation initiation factor 2B subunit (eIF-2B alpha/beta/delta family)
MLDKMRVRINKHYQEIMERDNFVTAEKVKNAFLRLEHRYHTLMQVFQQHNEDYAKQVEAGMKAKGTLLKYKTGYNHITLWNYAIFSNHLISIISNSHHLWYCL